MYITLPFAYRCDHVMPSFACCSHSMRACCCMSECPDSTFKPAQIISSLKFYSSTSLCYQLSICRLLCTAALIWVSLVVARLVRHTAHLVADRVLVVQHGLELLLVLNIASPPPYRVRLHVIAPALGVLQPLVKARHLLVPDSECEMIEKRKTEVQEEDVEDLKI